MKCFHEFLISYVLSFAAILLTIPSQLKLVSEHIIDCFNVMIFDRMQKEDVQPQYDVIQALAPLQLLT